ncbi:MAG: DUF3500 domain-containing protein [Gemmatimonadota bacterium]
MKNARIILLGILTLLVLAIGAERLESERPSAAMARAATDFLASLSPAQRDTAQFDFADAERLNWHFVPRVRRGLSFKEMTEPQRAAARRLLQTGLSQKGYLKAQTIIELENVLREMQPAGSNIVRDPELYFFSIFGTPSATDAWGWRFEGHHLATNFTVIRDSIVAWAPAFFGANPANVRTGPKQGTRALAAEEDIARELVTSLDAAQRATATIAAAAPRDIVTMNNNQIDPLSPVGIPGTQLRAAQSALLMKLIDEYLDRMAPDIAAQRKAHLARTDFGKVTFAWAGEIEVGKPHYYRVQGPTFLIEYDNTQNQANHIHSVWRDFNGDFGRDLLREHYRSGVHPH